MLICGDILSSSISEFLEELFHEDHERDDLQCVILQPEEPSYEMLLLLRDPKFSLCVTYLQVKKGALLLMLIARGDKCKFVSKFIFAEIMSALRHKRLPSSRWTC